MPACAGLISIHTPLAGSDNQRSASISTLGNFNPHSPCGERPIDAHRADAYNRISIHTPLAGSDTVAPFSTICATISIHTPLAGSDCRTHVSIHAPLPFQSTLPLRGATQSYNDAAAFAAKFQSTLPLRGATSFFRRIGALVKISIHTPLAGSDTGRWGSGYGLPYFNPHSPCGERRSLWTKRLASVRFQSTLPLRGATNAAKSVGLSQNISIHTPLAGSDASERHSFMDFCISIHTPLAGSDQTGKDAEDHFKISIHTPLAGSDRRNETFLTK